MSPGRFWEIIREDLVAAVQNFHEKGFLKKRVNAIFVALIPKEVWALGLNDFRSISLIGGVS